jgi:hypothetical protein
MFPSDDEATELQSSLVDTLFDTQVIPESSEVKIIPIAAATNLVPSADEAMENQPPTFEGPSLRGRRKR